MRRELADLVPSGWIQASLFSGIYILPVLTADRVGGTPWNGAILSSYTDAVPMFATMQFLGLAIVGLGQVRREIDRGTLAFIDSLPTTRNGLFIAKWCAGIPIAAAGPVSHMLAVAAVGTWHPDSMIPTFPWTVAAYDASLMIGVGVIAHTLALVAAWFGRASWLLLAMVVTASLTLTGLYPELQGLSFSDLATARWRGLSPERPSALGFHAGLLGGALLLAWALFQGIGDHAVRVARAWQRQRWVRWASVAGAIVVVLVLIIGLGVSADRSVKSRKEPPAWENAEGESAGFTMRWRSDRSATADAVESRADEVSQFVGEITGVHDMPRLEVDATGLGGADHLEGVAFGEAIRVNPFAEPETILATLAHESAHAVLHHESNGVITERHRSSRLLNEGYATWVEASFGGRKDWGPVHRAVMIQRVALDLDPEDVLDDVVMNVTSHPHLAYPMGHSFVASLAASIGKDAVPRLARAMGREDRPYELDDASVLRDAFDAAGLSFAQARQAWTSAMEPWRQEAELIVDGLPDTTLSVRISPIDDDFLEVRVLADAPPSARPGCVVFARRDASAAAGSITLGKVPQNGSQVRISAPPGITDEVDLLLMWILDDGTQVFGHWIRAHILPPTAGGCSDPMLQSSKRCTRASESLSPDHVIAPRTPRLHRHRGHGPRHRQRR